MCVHVYIYVCMYVGMYVCMYGPGIFPVAEGENGHRRMDIMRSALLYCNVPSGYLTQLWRITIFNRYSKSSKNIYKWAMFHGYVK